MTLSLWVSGDSSSRACDISTLLTKPSVEWERLKLPLSTYPTYFIAASLDASNLSRKTMILGKTLMKARKQQKLNFQCQNNFSSDSSRYTSRCDHKQLQITCNDHGTRCCAIVAYMCRIPKESFMPKMEVTFGHTEYSSFPGCLKSN